MDKTDDIVKIVYFDEGSATDYVQLKIGGSFMTEIAKTGATSDEGEAEVKGSVGVRAWFANLIKGSVSAEGSLSASFKDDTVVKSIVTNTVLTDFLAAVEGKESDERIEIIDNCKIVQIPGSISSLSLLTPYLSMLRSGQGIEAGKFNISLDKLDSTLTKAKGYFEFLGIKNDDSRIVLRFNGLGFKNNYKQGNLLNMNLRLYAVNVGETQIAELAADKELSVEGFSSAANPDYVASVDDAESTASDDESLVMYDVILAGVVSNG